MIVTDFYVEECELNSKSITFRNDGNTSAFVGYFKTTSRRMSFDETKIYIEDIIFP